MNPIARFYCLYGYIFIGFPFCSSASVEYYRANLIIVHLFLRVYFAIIIISKNALHLYQRRSVPLHPIPAADLLTVEFAFDVRCDPQLCGLPEAIHFPGEVFGKSR